MEAKPTNLDLLHGLRVISREMIKLSPKHSRPEFNATAYAERIDVDVSPDPIEVTIEG